MKLQLPDVTLVAVDTRCPELTRLAIDKCKKYVDFGDVQFHTNNPDYVAGETWVKTPFFKELTNVAEWVWYAVPETIQTSHVLFIHWDSWILDPTAWTDDFLQYDYIGAPWEWHKDGMTVGNGGFCLRSTKLMDFLSTFRDDFPLLHPEDDMLCRQYRRPYLEKEGFKWPSTELALKFAFERSAPQKEHFGFHGAFNWWRVLTPAEFAERVRIIAENPAMHKMLFQ